ncbi:MAG: inorganic phosphate transporter [Candidatus Sumerlaeaceae bacterium]|jgi:PiT family inorganic phosphate transporter
MSFIFVVVVLTIAAALIFDVINGFHDCANSIATIVSTRVLTPGQAVMWAAFFNFAAMFFFEAKVADTVSKIVKITSGESAYVYVVLCGLIGAIVWDLLTWWWGIPTSSSHALIGGFAGAGIAYGGLGIISWNRLWHTMIFIPAAPVLGMILAFAITLTVFWLFRNWRPRTVDKFFRKGQLLSAALYSLGHGGNDAQKTMGIIVALLVAVGVFSPQKELALSDPASLAIIFSCHLAMGIGTALGGWRIVKTMGMRLTKLQPVGGFCAELAGASTLFMATHFGIPVSTTHTITGAIVGVGATQKVSGVKWGIAGRIVWAWIFTIPCAALVSAACFLALKPFLH